ncbi:MAG: serine/threonine protein kinase [Sandaracinus sp.]|nr:serine/threonine protein kinase [Sandaracinus sp.]
MTPELDATLDAALATLAAAGLDASGDLATIAQLTITPPVSLRPGLVEPLKTGDRLRLGRTLGEGGMGLVRLAEQRVLHREVAVKTLKEHHELSVRKLLQEAWITGSLEHPNVVPIHDLGIDEEGVPFLVMKKIEGEAWAELIEAPERVRERFGADDVLEWHLRVLLQVCRALSYAHARGVVHRDLKPENVMVGAFGEVYVLDWGIAVALEDDGSGRLPLAKDATSVAGTPAYMAPEQLGGDDPRITPRTDVYLLGGMLFELLTGRPPHVGECLRDILASLFAPPPLDEGVPDELARIVRRAMDVDPEGRFENVDQLRLSVEGFLRHTDARRLAAKADALGAKLVAAQREGAEELAETHFAEARFAYRTALDAWPGGEEAREGLDALVLSRATHLLEIRDLAGCARLLASARDVPKELSERLAAAQREAKAAKERAEARDRDEDLEKGRRTRAFFAAVLGTLWVVFPLTPHLLGRRDMTNPTTIALVATFFLAVVSGLVLWARDSMLGTRLNRSIVGMLFAMLVMQLVFAIGFGSFLQLDEVQLPVTLIFFHATLAACAVVIIDLWLVPTAIAFVAAFFVAASNPEHANFCMSSANFVLLVNALVVNYSNRLSEISKKVHRNS